MQRCSTVMRAPKEERELRSLGSGVSGTVTLVEIRDPEIFPDAPDAWHLSSRKEIKERAQGSQEKANALLFSELGLYAFKQQWDGKLVMWQEFAPGEPLNLLLDHEGALRPWESVILLLTLLLVLRDLKEGLAAHTDLHPGNLIVERVASDSSGRRTRFHVIDYGLTCQMLSTTARQFSSPQCLPLGRYTVDQLRSPHAYLTSGPRGLDAVGLRDEISEHCDFPEELPLSQVPFELAHRNDEWTSGMLVVYSSLNKLPFDEDAFLKLPVNSSRAHFLQQRLPSGPVAWLEFLRRQGWPPRNQLPDLETKMFAYAISQLLDTSPVGWCVNIEDLIEDVSQLPSFEAIIHQLETERERRASSILCSMQQSARRQHRDSFQWVADSELESDDE